MKNIECYNCDSEGVNEEYGERFCNDCPSRYRVNNASGDVYEYDRKEGKYLAIGCLNGRATEQFFRDREENLNYSY